MDGGAHWPADAPAGKPALPLNLKFALLETTQPNQLAAWLLEQAKARKADLSGLVQEALRRAADPAQAAAKQAKRACTADTAFVDYRQAAMETAAQRAAEPKPAPAGGAGGAAQGRPDGPAGGAVVPQGGAALQAAVGAYRLWRRRPGDLG